MRPDSKRKLDQLLRRQRLRRLVPMVLIGAVVIAIVGYLYIPDKPVSERMLTGVVNEWTRPQTETGAGLAILTVQLQDGRSVIASSTTNKAPLNGQTVTLKERTYESGRIKYLWSE